MVPMLQDPPQSRRNRARPCADLQDLAVTIMAHHHAAGIARQTLRRFRGNAETVLEDGLARLLRIRQHAGVDMDHHLVTLARGAGIELVAEGHLGE
jgi:hypothetical protein